VHFITDSYKTHSSHDLMHIIFVCKQMLLAILKQLCVQNIWDLTKSRLISVTFENTVTNYSVTIVVILHIT